MPRAALLSLLVFVACRSEPGGPVHFAREEIRMEIRPGFLVVTGNYHFTNTADKLLRGLIHYPFPLDSSHRYPDSVHIPGHGFTRNDSGVSLIMEFHPGREDSFLVWYRQPLDLDRATYVVTTTRQWQRPIDTARFEVTVSAECRDPVLNYLPDSAFRTDSTLTWFFVRRRFYPAEDITVTWR